MEAGRREGKRDGGGRRKKRKDLKRETEKFGKDEKVW